MPTQQQPNKTTSKSKSNEFLFDQLVWIDYSSEEENQHCEDSDVVERKLSQEEKSKMLVETKQEKLNVKEKDNLLPVLSTSHQPVRSHVLEDRKAMLDQLRQIKSNSVWVELRVDSSNNFPYLKQQLQSLRNSHQKDIFNIYPSRDNKNGYDLRIAYDLCEKWIVEGVDAKNVIKIELRKRAQRQPQVGKNQRRYDNNRRDEYRPTTSTKQYQQLQTTQKYQPKYTQKKSNYIQQNDVEYVQKNTQTQEIEKRVQQSLKEKKKDQSKKDKGSKFYSKNPFEAFNDSD